VNLVVKQPFMFFEVPCMNRWQDHYGEYTECTCGFFGVFWHRFDAELRHGANVVEASVDDDISRMCETCPGIAGLNFDSLQGDPRRLAISF
jgi:hypothetical protein